MVPKWQRYNKNGAILTPIFLQSKISIALRESRYAWIGGTNFAYLIRIMFSADKGKDSDLLYRLSDRLL